MDQDKPSPTTTTTVQGQLNVVPNHLPNLKQDPLVRFAIVNESNRGQLSEEQLQSLLEEKEQEIRRERYLAEIKSSLRNESAILRQRIVRTLEKQRSQIDFFGGSDESVVSPWWNTMPRKRAFSHGDITEVKRSKSSGKLKRIQKLKRQTSQTLPSTPIVHALKRQASIILEEDVKKPPLSDNQFLFIDGLILDPKKLFGHDRHSISSSDVSNHHKWTEHAIWLRIHGYHIKEVFRLSIEKSRTFIRANFLSDNFP